jgi:hypothetical protein
MREEKMSTIIRVVLILSIGAGLLLGAAPAVRAAQGELDAYTIESLLFVREEEKLARDTYLALYDIWGTAVFQTIAASEQSHMDAIKKLLDKYGLEDPALDELGAFQDPFLQAKYHELIAWGSQSEAEALRVGGYIEEMDIIDLTERLAGIDRGDVRRVFQNLLDGSKNHLRAFVRQYESLTGEKYIPQLLDQSTFKEIINADSESGSGGGEKTQRRTWNGGGERRSGPRR